MKQYTERIQKIFQEWEGHPFDACLEIVNLFSNKDIEPWMIIKEVLSIPIRIGDDEAELQGISQDDYNRYVYRYQDYLTSLSEALSMKDTEQDEFYKELFNNVFASDIIPEDQCHQALYLHLLSDRIKILPYYPTNNSLKLKEEEYKEIFERIKPQLSMAFHMCARKFDTKTEKTSQYWQVANQLSEREEQIVFWSVVIQMEQNNMKSDD